MLPIARSGLGCPVVMWMPPSCLSWACHWTLVSVPRADCQSLMRPLGQAEGARVPQSSWEAGGTGAQSVCVLPPLLSLFNFVDLAALTVLAPKASGGK